MTNVLVKKILLLAFMLTMMSFASAQSISYKSSFDFQSGATFTTSASVASEETSPTDLAFSNDGLTVFTIGGAADEINQYALTSAYDISGGLTHEASYSVSTEESVPYSLIFNDDGTRFYIIGTSSRTVYQYSLSTGFDLSSTVELEGSYYTGITYATAIHFNDDGTRLFVGNYTGTRQIYQYDLSNAFDVTSGTITAAGSSESLLSGGYDIHFANGGSDLFLMNTSDAIVHYSLETAYDVSSTLTEVGDAFSVITEENNAFGLCINPSGNRLFVVGSTGDDINQYDLNVPVFSESIINNGSIDESFTAFGLTGETFANPGETLVYNTDYTISNLPAGLIPVLDISSTGLNGTLSFNGSATYNENADGVASLNFTFNNSAFAGGDASSVLGASGPSGIEIDFRNNGSPMVTYGSLPNVSGAAFNENVLDISVDVFNAGGMTFNNDGTKLFIIDTQYDYVYDYSLTTPYDITSGASYSGDSYYIGGDETLPTGVAFSTDGLTMFIVGQTGDDVTQYSLSAAYDLTSTIENQGTFSVIDDVAGVHDISFSPDGKTMLLCGPDLYQYSLTTPFDITSGVSHESTFDQTYTILSAVFGPDGSQILYTNSNRIMGIYDLANPYDLSGGVSGGGGINVLSQENSPTGVTFSPNRKKIFMCGSGSDNVNQYAISPDKFEESFNDNGSIIGTLRLRIINDQFNNATATLTQGTHYNVTGLPSGLSSSLTIASNGLTADMTLDGTATSSDIADDVENLTFTFNNSAFKNSDAADVLNAVSGDSYFSVKFKELSGQIFGSDAYQLTGMTFDNNPVSVVNETGSPYQMTFNNDGSTMFIISSDGNIYQYTLTTPYDISSGITPEGTPLDVSANESIPVGMTFNHDGSKMYIIGSGNDKVHQYSLGTSFDINGTVTHEGEFSFTNGIGITFSPEGSRMFLTSGSLVYQYALNTPFDITAGASQVGSAQTGSANSYSPTFSPNGMEFFVMGGSHRNIYRYPLSSAFDITDGLTSDQSLSVSGQDTSPSSMAFSGDGKTLFVTGLVGDDINIYELPGISFSEVAANSGALDGEYTFSLIGDSFVNAGGTLSPDTHFSLSGLPSGLSGSMAVSGDGTTANLSFSGNAVDHQDANDGAVDIQIAFLNAAFTGGSASAVSNSSLTLAADIDFTDNGSLTYTPEVFTETYLNTGEVDGSMLITIANETFSQTGLLTDDVDYSITGIPTGLSPELTVAGNRLSATLTLTGTANSHQDIDDVSDLTITFESSAFTSSDAQYVFNAINANTGSTIDFEDNNPKITYGNQFDLSDYPEYRPSVTYDFTAEEDSPGSMAFSNDGMKMFIVGYTNDALFEYNLTSAFDISEVTYSGNSYTLAEVNSPGDLVFDPTGTIMFILDGSGDEVDQYSLSAAFDLSSTITHEGAFKVNTEDIQPSGITFSPNGKKMYMIGSSNDKIFQYTLTSPFDITSGISYDDVEASVSSLNYTDIQISEDGKNIFLSNSAFPSSSNIRQYELNTPFDISDGISAVGGFYFHDIDYGPTDFVVSTDRKRLIVIGGQFNLVYQFDLDVDGFREISANNGEIEGTLHIEIDDDTFANAGFTMTYGSDYTIDNLPAGLAATMTVSADGTSASVSLSGVADNHQNVDDAELVFTFNNSAFVNSNAADVQNAIAASSERMIDYRDNNPALNYGNTLDMDFATATESPLDVSSYSDYTSGIIFSNDGMKMFISVYGLGTVYEYALSSPYDLADASQVASYDHSVEDMYAEDLAFSTDGMKMFVLGSDNYIIYQYNLTSSFDISTGVSYSGISFSYEDYDTSVYGFTFNPDGSRLYLGGGNENAIMQFTLSTPFDISSATFDNQFDLIDASPTGMKFSSDGRYMVITDDNDYITIRYRLNVPYDVTQGGNIEETFDLDAIGVWPSGLGVSPDGSRIFIADGGNYEILQYNVDLGDFTETLSNDGSLEGTARIYLIDDTFVNAGSTLSHGIDYTINNLPSGLIPTLTVAADGYSAALSMAGTANNHGDSDDLTSLQFTFNNSSFANYDATEVSNSNSYDAGFGIDFVPYAENDIESFTFSGIDGNAAIDEGTHTVTAQAVAGTDISAITPTIGVSQNGSIAPNSGVVQDFSSAVTYTVTAEDGGTQDWDVTITEVEVAPTDIILTSTSVDENSASGTVVAELSSLDANFNETFTYYVVAVLENDDWQSFDIDGSNLITTNFISLDFETKNEFTFELEVRDSENEAYSEMVTITLNDVNEAPSDIALDNATIDESNPSGTVVGALSVTDEDLTDNHTYSLKGGVADNTSFDINGDQLVTAVELDFETKSSYTVEVIVTDQGGLTFEKAFAVSVNDLPAQVTSFTLSNYSVNENESSGTTVGTMNTFGEDLSGSYTYTLVSGTGDTDNNLFSISNNLLLTAASFDFEIQSSYSIRMMTDDGGGNTLEQAFTITVNDVSEAPTDIQLSGTSITENNSVGESIGTLSTTDEDAGESFTYDLVSGSGDTDNASFEIVGNELQALEIFDFETQNSYSVRIETNDGNGGTFSKSFTIAVVNQNESILVTNPIADQELDEGFTTQEIDLTNVFTDQDGDALTYQASSSDETIVTVSNSGALLTITEVGNFGPSTVTVTANDGSGVTTSDEFIVTVSNVNDAPIVVNATVDQELDEGFNSIELDLSGTFSDEDGDVLSLEVSSGDETVVTANIAGSTLTITEVGNGMTTVTVTANDGNGGTASDEFLVTVNNINDAPTIASAITDQNLNEGFGSAEIDISGTFTDEDGDALTYSVTSSNETVVTISESNAILTITEVGLGTSTITVTADDGNGETISDEFTVTVNNVNDAPIVVNPLNDQTSLVEGFSAAQINYSDVFEDEDGDVLTITVSSSDETVVTVEVIANDQIQINEVGIGTSTITLTANDGNGGSVSDEFIVTISEAPNNAPVVINPLDDQTGVEEGFGAVQINYADVFEDADGDILTITVTSSDEAVVTVEVIANNQIQVNEVGIGTSTITLTADDGNGGTVSDEFIFTVNEAPLGVADLEVKIYPNPSSDFIYVKSNVDVSVRLTDLNGKTIERKSGSQLEFDIQSLSSGLYILRVSNGDRSSDYRIIKAN